MIAADVKSHGRRALIVHRDSGLIEVLERVCRGEGLAPEICDDRERALELLKRRNYDILVLDLQASSAGGLELIEHLKGAAPAMLQRVVVFTGMQGAARSIEPGVVPVASPDLFTLRYAIRRILTGGGAGEAN